MKWQPIETAPKDETVIDIFAIQYKLSAYANLGNLGNLKYRGCKLM